MLGSAAAFAQAPPIIPLQGYVTDAEGAPLSGPASVDVSFHDSAVDGEPLFEESLVVVVGDGFFSAEIGLTEVLDLALFRDTSEVWVEIAIDDNGAGVPEEERRMVFERFSRGSTASHSGSGLGLALVAQQAGLHGGTASLEDSPMGGVRLMLRLPPPR